ncbi:MAG: SemiSWEET family sugar transporter [Chitinophagales bacterium]|nr:SemiSWEET family sugar transporter [Chitinophagales bacterium]OJV23717.1 MAG: hypothetical protein BGO32_13175 [Bacteroidetes bacterium 37-13]HRN93774.1 SemiSWEET transporter [Chitinophagales bacterium]HRP40422.1 SemiSWEET transporter [Chitinophagales bacterium]
MELTEAIGTGAAICTTTAFIPQIIQIVKTRNTQSISLTMYSIFTLGVLLWLVYGLYLNSFPIILANAATLVLAGCVLLMKIYDVQKGKNKD